MDSVPQLPTFLKWAGGKRRILPKIERYFPKNIERYFEPFLGGGSVFFHIKQKYNPSFCMLSDTNEDLIATYIAVRDNPSRLINYLKDFRKANSKENYYKIRKEFNGNKIKGIKRAATFIYLNKTCFNGLYRVNSKDEFNVPYGKLRSPLIFNEASIFEASKLLNDRVKIKCQDYKSILSKIKKGDFAYLDPCYDPLKKTSFAHYTAERFSNVDRDRLFRFIDTLRIKGVKVILNNNDIPEVRILYGKNYKLDEVIAPRYIASKATYRKDVRELVISTNF